MMVVFLILLVVYNVTAYLLGDKNNFFAMFFGQRQAAKTPPSGQQAQPSVPAQSVKESQDLEAAAQSVGQQTKVSGPSQQSPSASSPQVVQKPEDASSSGQTAAPSDSAAGGQTVSQTQTPAPSAQTTVTGSAIYEELGTLLYYREDPFKPLVVPAKIAPPPSGFLPVVRPVKGPCGSVLAASFTDSSLIWPTEKSVPPSGSAGLPPLPGMDGTDGAALEKEPPSGGGLKLTGIIFDSQPIALIRFNGKDVNVRINQRVGNCRVLVISRNQVVLSEPNGKQRRLFL